MYKVKIILSREERQLPDSTLVKRYGISRPTAWRAKKRGWFAFHYHNRKPVRVDLNKFDLDMVIRICHTVYYRVVLPLWSNYQVRLRNENGRYEGLSRGFRLGYPYVREPKDDFIQEGVVAILERSGDTVKGDLALYYFAVAKFAMLHLARSGKTGVVYE